MQYLTSFVFVISSIVLQSDPGSASTLTPPVLPLIVRNPYLSTWLADARQPPWQSWPMFYTGEHLGFSIMASIPGSSQVFPLLGRPQDSLPSSLWPKVTEPSRFETSFDASTTNITYWLDLDSTIKMSNSTKVTVSFLSPITPESTLRQSLPAAYFTVHTEGQCQVNIYTDVNGQWVSGDRDSNITWDIDPRFLGETSHNVKSWQISREAQALLTETNDRSEWGTLYFTGPQYVSHQAGTSELLRRQFVEKGGLTNGIDEDFRRIMDNEPVFAFATTLSPTLKDHVPDRVTFTVGLVQNPVVQFAASRGLTMMRPFWTSYMPTAQEMIVYHFNDFLTAANLATEYSGRLAADAKALASTTYQDIVALSARQVLGATQFSGTPENPILFLKEISSNGNFQTVDVIFPSFPFFLYTNPRWLIYLLEPLIEHQLSGQYPNNYSMHDLGTHFPNATGHNDGNDEYMPVEECGDMLIMGLAVVNALKAGLANIVTDTTSASTAYFSRHPLAMVVDENGFDRHLGISSAETARQWIERSYKLWKQWAGYLVRESLIPRNQLSTDDFAGTLANQTNLALKGIVGIRAMSELSDLVGDKEEAQRYRNISETYIDKWQDFGISRDRTHAKLAYTWYGSWTTIYNLFADALLCFHLPDSSSNAMDDRKNQKPLYQGPKKEKPFIPNKIYTMQSRWYRAVMQRYGLPLDSRHLYTKSDWEFFAGAVVSNSTRDVLVEAIGRWVNNTVTDRPLTDLYDTEGQGDFSPVRFMARPVVGGHFAPLALSAACGGEAMRGLSFLNQDEQSEVDVEAALAADVLEGARVSAGDWEPELGEL